MKKILVAEKENVKKNQAIGLVGKKGFATSAHLHFKIKYKNELIDPIEFVNLPMSNDF